jgi:hypothetical protein
MSEIPFELSDSDDRQLDEVAAGRGLTRAQLVRLWIEERLLHERERAAGITKPPGPRPSSG